MPPTLSHSHTPLCTTTYLACQVGQVLVDAQQQLGGAQGAAPAELQHLVWGVAALDLALHIQQQQRGGVDAFGAFDTASRVETTCTAMREQCCRRGAGHMHA